LADDPEKLAGAEEERCESTLSRRAMLERTSIGVAAVLVGCGDGGGVDDGGTLPADMSGTDNGTVPSTDGGPVRMDAGPGQPDMRPLPDGGMDDVRSLPASDRFPLGVASGDATEDSIILWTRYDGSGALTLAVWELLADGADGARVLDLAVTPDDAGFVHETIAVSAGQRYGYAFVEDATARSTIGRFRAALASDAMEPLIFGAVSCTRNGRSFDTLLRAGERDDLDAFLLLGDTTYNDGESTVEGFRAKWAENFSTEGYIATRAAASLLATWDDHEIDNNWDPENTATPTVDAGRQAFFDHLPLERLAEDPERVWRSRRWGRTLEVFVLDCRSERRPSTRDDADAEYISTEQMDWLKAGLSSSTAVFKVILNSVGITDFPFLLDLGSNDRWEGYAAQREDILDFIDDAGIGGVLWVAGDFHFSSLGRVGGSGDRGENQWEVLVGPGAQVSNPLHSALTGSRWPYAGGTNNFTELRFDPSAGEIRVRFIDGGGGVIADESIAP